MRVWKKSLFLTFLLINFLGSYAYSQLDSINTVGIEYELSVEAQRNGYQLRLSYFIQNTGRPFLMTSANLRLKVPNYSALRNTPILANDVVLVDSLIGVFDQGSNSEFDSITYGFNPISGILSLNINSSQSLSGFYRIEDELGRPLPINTGAFGFPVSSEKTLLAAIDLSISQSAGEIDFNWFNGELLVGPITNNVYDLGEKINLNFPLDTITISSPLENSFTCDGDALSFRSNITGPLVWQHSSADSTWNTIDSSNNPSISLSHLNHHDKIRAITPSHFDGATFQEYSSNAISSNIYQINLGGDPTINLGEQLLLYSNFSNPGDTNANFVWSPATVLTNPTSENTMTLLQESETIELVVTIDDISCELRDELNIEVLQFVSIRAKVNLQGAYNETTNKMDVNLLSELQTEFGIVPPANTVDVIQVQLRFALTDTNPATAECWLLSDGRIVEIGTNNLDVKVFDDNLYQGDRYYVQLKHRNHLFSSSSKKIGLTVNPSFWDFTRDGRTLGSTVSLSNGGVAIPAGDVNQDFIIDQNDESIIQGAMISGLAGYVVEDITLDGVVNALDVNLIMQNKGQNYKSNFKLN